MQLVTRHALDTLSHSRRVVTPPWHVTCRPLVTLLHRNVTCTFLSRTPTSSRYLWHRLVTRPTLVSLSHPRHRVTPLVTLLVTLLGRSHTSPRYSAYSCHAVTPSPNSDTFLSRYMSHSCHVVSPPRHAVTLLVALFVILLSRCHTSLLRYLSHPCHVVTHPCLVVTPPCHVARPTLDGPK